MCAIAGYDTARVVWSGRCPQHVEKSVMTVRYTESAFISHPQFNKTDPEASPRPLFFAADFVKTTYLNYLLPLLPKDVQYKSPTIANRGIFPYAHVDPSLPPFPEKLGEGQKDTWLEDMGNWPAEEVRKSAKYRELYMDVFTRTMTIAMTVNDTSGRTVKLLGGDFDWDAVPEIRRITREIMPDR
ncbi:hypothetical protein R6Q59_009869 [Mikania micrantha]